VPTNHPPERRAEAHADVAGDARNGKGAMAHLRRGERSQQR
jgi:hypothetical protein